LERRVACFLGLDGCEQGSGATLEDVGSRSWFGTWPEKRKGAGFWPAPLASLSTSILAISPGQSGKDSEFIFSFACFKLGRIAQVWGLDKKTGKPGDCLPDFSNFLRQQE
jgi:hypothetical protein